MLLAGVALLLMVPALLAPWTMSGDSFLHVRWQHFFADAVWQGDLYPRWLGAMDHGFGSPAFFIYPPLEQWLGALFWPLLPGGDFAPHRLMAGLALAKALGGVGAFLWIRALGVGRGGALVGALAYLLLPYHAYLNAYQRGALAELVAMGALPFGFAFAHGLKARVRFAWAGFALAIAALFYSHAPTALFAVPVTCLYALLLADRPDAAALTARIAGAALLGAGLAAAYLGTALTQSGAINTRVLFGGLYQAQNYLLFSTEPWPDAGIRLLVTAIALMHLILLAGLALLLRRANALSRPAIVMIALSLLIFLAITAPAHALWAPEWPWSKIQFAWRMLSLQTLMLAGLTGLVWRSSGRTIRRLLIAGLPLLLLLDAALFTARLLHSTSPSPMGSPAWASVLREEVAEYRLGDVEALRERFGDSEAIVLAGQARVTASRQGERGFALAVDAATPATIAIHQFVYTGWEARIDRGAWTAAGRSAPLEEVATVAVPAGQHGVELRLARQTGESWGYRLSAIALLLLLAGLLYDRRRRALA